MPALWKGSVDVDGRSCGWIWEHLRDVRYVQEMGSLLWCDEVGDIDNERGFREDVNFVRWVGACVALIWKRRLSALLSIAMCCEK